MAASFRTCWRAWTGAAVALVVALASAGCGRAHYRRSADEETYGILAENRDDPRWDVPDVSLQPEPESRLFDPSDPDCPPMPPDDPAAHHAMHHPAGLGGYRHWHDQGDAPSVENAAWREFLETESSGELVLTPERALELALLHSREYQGELEDLYFTALALSLNRFEFRLHWFAQNDTFYRHFGTSSRPPGGNESNTLSTDSRIGFSRALATGGQLLVDFANSLVWEFTGRNTMSASSTIGITLIQPLLRRAGREVRLEGLTQAERDVLYAVRDFARFRKQFYFGVTSGSGGYMSLLLTLQNIRNLEANLTSLERNLREHEALVEAGSISLVQLDRVAQSYQQGRLSLTQARQSFGIELDNYKLRLGLPPGVPVRLDDALLAPFELNDPEITRLQEEIEQFLAGYRALDTAPTAPRLRDGFVQLRQFLDRAGGFIDLVNEELARWESGFPEIPPEGPDPARTERIVHRQLAEQMFEVPETFAEIARLMEAEVARLRDDTQEVRDKAWDAIQRLTRQALDGVAELFVIQTVVRVHLIRLRPVDMPLADAVAYADANRLDLMNQRARVVDAWRRIRVAADALEADLDVRFDASIGTEPGTNNPFDFAASNSSYRVGFHVDGPLNRQAERNAYRAALIEYQRVRRAYMAQRDRIEQAIRAELGQLETDRLNFDIARQSLIIAARQVEQSRENLPLVADPRNSSGTQDILDALRDLLSAKNNLIGIWVRYETTRLQLLLDLEALQLDERGVYSDEHDRPTEQPARDGEQPTTPAADDGAAAGPQLAAEPHEWPLEARPPGAGRRWRPHPARLDR